MTGRVITVAQQKGGAGKTSVAAHLAVALAASKRRVAMLDIDPQGSLSQWWALRCDLIGEPRPGLQLTTCDGWRAQAEIDRLRRNVDIVVVDSPPHAERESKTAIRAADLVIVPLQPSALDLWATRATLELAAAEHRPVLLVLNRVPPRSALAAEMIAGAAQFGAMIAETRLGNRVGFAAALAQGRVVTETAPGTTAAREAGRLAREVAALLDAEKPRSR